MIALFLLLPALVVGLLLWRRRVLRDRRAGLDAARPTFTVYPPPRRLGKLRDGHL